MEATELSAAAAAVEQALREGRMEGLSSLIQTLEKELAPAIAAVASLEVKQENQPGNRSRTSPAQVAFEQGSH